MHNHGFPLSIVADLLTTHTHRKRDVFLARCLRPAAHVTLESIKDETFNESMGGIHCRVHLCKSRPIVRLTQNVLVAAIHLALSDFVSNRKDLELKFRRLLVGSKISSYAQTVLRYQCQK